MSASAFFRLASAAADSPRFGLDGHALHAGDPPVGFAELTHEAHVAARVRREPFEVIERDGDEPVPGVGRSGQVLDRLVEGDHPSAQAAAAGRSAGRRSRARAPRRRRPRPGCRSRARSRPPTPSTAAGPCASGTTRSPTAPARGALRGTREDLRRTRPPIRTARPAPCAAPSGRCSRGRWESRGSRAGAAPARRSRWPRRGRRPSSLRTCGERPVSSRYRTAPSE